MNMKQIKNYIIVAVIVFGGLLTLWNQFNPDSNNTEANAVSNNTEANVDSNNTEANEVDQDSEEGNKELKYNVATESIKGYTDVLGVVWLENLDNHIAESYEKYDADVWQGLVDGQSNGTKAGGRWGNYDDQLPEYNLDGSDITYKEFDVNDKINGQSRDAQRFVVGSDGSVYYTLDHYDSYTLIIK